MKKIDAIMPVVIAAVEGLLAIAAIVLGVLSIWPWAFLCLLLAIWLEVGS